MQIMDIKISINTVNVIAFRIYWAIRIKLSEAHFKNSFDKKDFFTDSVIML